MMNNNQTYDGAVTVIGESQIGTSKLGRPKGSADICQVYEIKSVNEESNVFTCKGRMGGKKGGRKACQYFFLDGTSKAHLRSRWHYVNCWPMSRFPKVMPS